MFTLGENHKYYYYIGITDMRKSFNSLSGLVLDHIQSIPSENRVYLFVNRRRDKIKILQWQASGYLLYYKRLEQGTFKFPHYEIERGLIELSYTEMIMLIDGISIINLNKSKRFTSK